MKKNKKICKTTLVVSIALILIACLFNPDGQFMALNIIIWILGFIAFLSIVGRIVFKIWEE